MPSQPTSAISGRKAKFATGTFPTQQAGVLKVPVINPFL